jgi:hypothetical protein
MVGRKCPDRSSESLKKGAFLMSEDMKKCVLVAPGHNLPAEFNPKKAEALDVQRVRLLAAGVLELGYCECEKEMRFMPKSPWSNIMRCPHLVLTHSEELLNAVRDGRVKSLVIKEMQYAFGVLVWSVELRTHFWLKKLESPTLINDYQLNLFNGYPQISLNVGPIILPDKRRGEFLDFQLPQLPNYWRKRSKVRFFLNTPTQRFRRFVLDRFSKQSNRVHNFFYESGITFEIEENSPCYFIIEGKD